jgi:16S rRNA (uracil1498-N3)-methyltransferase
MNIPFFYSAELHASDTDHVLDEAASRHCVQVLRRAVGDPVALTDGKGACVRGVITVADKRKCKVSFTAMDYQERPAPRLGIGIGFTKQSARMEWFVEKATEIGISDIYPLDCARGERARINYQRLDHVLIAAMLQSQRVYLPKLHPPQTMPQMLEEGSHYRRRFIAHCIAGPKVSLPAALPPAEDVLVLIGPEGDFVPEEIALAQAGEFLPLSLGESRLRTETAGVVAVALMQAAQR